jgi:hypothetical protein
VGAHAVASDGAADIACPVCGKIRPLLVKAKDDVAVEERTNTELWRAALFAASWYNDSLAEARRDKGDIDARRRAIVVAVCFIESYLYEWTNFLVGPREIDRYLPPEDREGIRERWSLVGPSVLWPT